MIEPGSIMREIGVSAGKPITKEGLEKLQKVWVEVYLVFQLLMSRNPVTQDKLTTLKMNLAESNEAVMEFFDNATGDGI